jgi:hypothetical protein
MKNITPEGIEWLGKNADLVPMISRDSWRRYRPLRHNDLIPSIAMFPVAEYPGYFLLVSDKPDPFSMIGTLLLEAPNLSISESRGFVGNLWFCVVYHFKPSEVFHKPSHDPIILTHHHDAFRDMDDLDNTEGCWDLCIHESDDAPEESEFHYKKTGYWGLGSRVTDLAAPPDWHLWRVSPMCSEFLLEVAFEGEVLDDFTNGGTLQVTHFSFVGMRHVDIHAEALTDEILSRTVKKEHVSCDMFGFLGGLESKIFHHTQVYADGFADAIIPTPFLPWEWHHEISKRLPRFVNTDTHEEQRYREYLASHMKKD